MKSPASHLRPSRFYVVFRISVVLLPSYPRCAFRYFPPIVKSLSSAISMVLISENICRCPPPPLEPRSSQEFHPPPMSPLSEALALLSGSNSSSIYLLFPACLACLAPPRLLRPVIDCRLRDLPLSSNAADAGDGGHSSRS